MKHFKRVAFILIGLIVTICLSGFGYVYFKLNKMYVKDEAVKNTEEQGTMVEGITNILLVGTDGEYVEKGNRSDGMMVVTIDSKNKDIRISSIARDTYVDIPGYSTEKLTHAYAYEGIDLLKEVFKVNFNLDKNADKSDDSQPQGLFNLENPTDTAPEWIKAIRANEKKL